MNPFAKKASIIFGVSALASFALFFAQQASASISITVPGRSCFVSGGGCILSIPGGSAISAPGGISQAYLDFTSTGSNSFIVSELDKITYSGTMYSDSVAAYYPAGFHEVRVYGGNVNNSISQWDYFYATFVGSAGSGMTIPSNIIGVGIYTK